MEEQYEAPLCAQCSAPMVSSAQPTPFPEPHSLPHPGVKRVSDIRTFHLHTHTYFPSSHFFHNYLHLVVLKCPPWKNNIKGRTLYGL